MDESKFETALFLNGSATGESLRHSVSAYKDCVLNDEITDLVVADIYNSIRDHWDSSISDSIHACLTTASRIEKYSKTSDEPNEYLLSMLRNETSTIKMELGVLARDLGVNVSVDGQQSEESAG